MRKKYFRRFWIILILILISVSGCDNGSESYDSTIVCLGNSLTAGYGTAPSFPYSDPSKAYPAQLQKKVNRDVINSGVSGITTAGALARLDSGVLKYDPIIVVIELGANDFFQGIEVPFSEANILAIISETKENLQDIITLIDNGERKIYLAKFFTQEVGEDFLTQEGITETGDQITILTNYNTMFSDLVIANPGIELIEDIWAGVWDIHMYSDGIHPNATGYSIMADNYFNAMEPYLEDNGLVK